MHKLHLSACLLALLIPTAAAALVAHYPPIAIDETTEAVLNASTMLIAYNLTPEADVPGTFFVSSNEVFDPFLEEMGVNVSDMYAAYYAGATNYSLPDNVTEQLMYQIVMPAINTSQWPDRYELFPTYLDDEYVYLRMYNGIPLVNGIEVVVADINDTTSDGELQFVNFIDELLDDYVSPDMGDMYEAMMNGTMPNATTYLLAIFNSEEFRLAATGNVTIAAVLNEVFDPWLESMNVSVDSLYNPFFNASLPEEVEDVLLYNAFFPATNSSEFPVESAVVVPTLLPGTGLYIRGYPDHEPYPYLQFNGAKTVEGGEDLALGVSILHVVDKVNDDFFELM